jgi:hypothetical protein
VLALLVKGDTIEQAVMAGENVGGEIFESRNVAAPMTVAMFEKQPSGFGYRMSWRTFFPRRNSTGVSLQNMTL